MVNQKKKMVNVFLLQFFGTAGHYYDFLREIFLEQASLKWNIVFNTFIEIFVVWLYS